LDGEMIAHGRDRAHRTAVVHQHDCRPVAQSGHRGPDAVLQDGCHAFVRFRVGIDQARRAPRPQPGTSCMHGGHAFGQIARDGLARSEKQGHDQKIGLALFHSKLQGGFEDFRRTSFEPRHRHGIRMQHRNRRDGATQGSTQPGRNHPQSECRRRLQRAVVNQHDRARPGDWISRPGLNFAGDRRNGRHKSRARARARPTDFCSLLPRSPHTTFAHSTFR
jgi:hypothetical protein